MLTANTASNPPVAINKPESKLPKTAPVAAAEVIHALVFTRYSSATQVGNWLLRPMANSELHKPMPKAIKGRRVS